MVAAVTVSRHSKLFNDVNGDNKATPGDTLITHIDITNPTGAQITNVVVNDTLTSGTTYVNGTTIVTASDAYALEGNTPITFGAAQGLLANDYHFDGGVGIAGTNNGLTVAAVNGGALGSNILIHDSVNGALTAGTLNIAADGSFTFTPAAGYNGTAAFNYDVSDGNGIVGHQNVSLVVSGYTWYVQGGAATNGDGTFGNPFNNMASVSTVDHANDKVVLHGSTTTSSAFVMKAGEILYGDGSTYSTNGHAITTGSATDSTINHSAGGIQVSTNNTIDGVDLVGTTTTATGLTDSAGTVGTLTINHMAISGQGQIADIDQGGTLAVTLQSIGSTGFTTAGQSGALDLQGVTGSFTVSGATTINTTTAAQASGGINVSAAGLTATFTGAAAVSTGASNAVTLGAGTEKFDGGATLTTSTGNALTTTGGTISAASGSITTTTGQAVNMSATSIGSGNVTLSSITTGTVASGNALTFSNVDGNTFNGGNVTVAGTAGVGADGIHIDTGSTTNFSFSGATLGGAAAIAGDGIEINGTGNGTATFTTVAINNTGGDGVNIVNSNNSVTISGGTIGNSNDPAGADLHINGGTGAVSVAASLTKTTTTGTTLDISGHSTGQIDVSGAISSTGTGLSMVNNTGGTINISNASVVLNTGTNNAITFTNTSGTGATVNFSGGNLNVDTTSGTGLNATSSTVGAGALNITGANNSIASTTGRAINVDGVTSNITLHDVSVTGGGSTTGIFLKNTGAGGQFVVTGTGTTAGTGGALANIGGANAGSQSAASTTGTGIYMENVSNVSLSNMNFTGAFTNFGIRGENVNNFTLKDSNLTGTFGDNAGLMEGAIRFGTQSNGSTAGLTGTALFSGNTIQGGDVHNLAVFNYGSSTLNMTIQDSAAHGAIFNANNAVDGGSDVLVETGGTSNLTLASTGVTYNGAHDANLNVTSLAQTVQTISVTGNTFANTETQTSGAPNLRISGSLASTNLATNGKVSYTVDNNTFKGSEGANIFASFNGSQGTINGLITNNTFGTPGGGYSNAIGTRSSLNGGAFFGGIDSKFTNSGTINYAIRFDNNVVADWGGVFGFVVRGAAQDGTGTARVEATLTGNTFEEAAPGGVASGAIAAQVAGTGNFGTIGFNLTNNHIDLTGTTAADAVYLDNTSSANGILYMPGLTPASGASSAQVASFLTGKGNTFTNAGSLDPSGVVLGGPIIAQNFQLAVPENATPPSGLGWQDLLPAEKPINDPTVTVSNPADASGGTGSTGSTGTTPPADTTPVPPPAPVQVTDNLTQEVLNEMVAAAIHRWEVAGATPEQLAAMRAVSVTVSAMGGFQVGDSVPGHVTISANGAGYGWFVDATPDDDAEFTGTGSDLHAAAGSAAAGHIDLLTVIEHELGHQIGLSDLYQSTQTGDIMYGFVDPSERRLPTSADAAAASGTPSDHESFALSPVTIGAIPAGGGVDISFRSTVNNFSAGLTPTLSGTSSVTVNGGGPLTASESINSINDTMTNSNGIVTTQALSVSSLTLGNLVYNDVNKNGSFDSGTDTGIGGVTVKLYVDTNSNGVYDAGVDTFVGTTTTSSVAGTLGQYSFTGLAEGDYVVVIPSTNFGSGNPLGSLVPHNGATDPDNDVNNDNNGAAVGSDVASKAITLTFGGEPTTDGDADANTNLTVDFGFQTNTPPTAVADTLGATAEDTPVTYAATDFTGNDSDPDGDTFTITSVTNGSHGTAVLNGDGTVTYTPAANYNGTDTFTYTITDSHGASTTANASLTITAVNDPVTATVPLPVTVNEDSSGNAVTGLSISDVDATLAPAGVYVVTLSATHGTLTLTTLTGLTFTGGSDGTADATMTFHGTLSDINTALATAKYTPDANYAGSAQIELQVTDDFGGTVATGTGSATNDDKTVAVTVTGVNDAPVVTDESATTDDATNYTFHAADFTAHFSDPNDSPANAPANVIVTSLPPTGTLIYDGTPIAAGSLPFTISIADLDAGKLVYDPADLSGGSDYMFGFKVQDDGGTLNSGQDTSSAHTFTMHVLVSDVAPVIDLDGTTGAVDTTNSASYTEQAAPTILAANIGLSDSDDTDLAGATVSIGTGFQAGKDILSVNGATSGTITGITFSYDGTTGVLTLSGTATVADYQALLQQVGFESTSDAPGTSRDISWTVTDGTLPSTAVHTTVTVTPVNDAPSGADSSTSSPEDAVYTLHASDFHFTDPDGDSLGSVTINSVTGGTVYFDSDGAGGADPVAVTLPTTVSAADLAADKLTFVPDANVNGNGTASISFNVTDDSGQADDTSTSANTLTFDLTPVNDAPVASGSATAAAIDEDTPGAGETVSTLFGGNFSDATDDQSANVGGSSPNTLAGVAVTANGSTAGTGHWQYFNGASWVDISTSVSDSSALLLSSTTLVRFNPAQDYEGAAPTLTVHLIDSSAGAVTTGNTADLSGVGATGGTTAYSTGTVDLGDTINAVNDAPAFSGLDNTPTFTEGGPATQLDSNATVTDVDVTATNYDGATLTLARHGGADPDDLFSAAPGVTLSGGNVDVGATNVGTFTQSGGTLTITFNANATQALVNQTLQSLSYSNLSDNPPSSAQIDYVFTDNNAGAQGSGGSLSGTGSITVSITPTNDAPVAVFSAHDFGPVNEQTAFDLKDQGLSVSDIDGNSGSETVTLSVGEGTLTVTAGTSGAGVSGSGTGTVTITGTIAQINDLLNTNATSTVSYIDNSDTPSASTSLTLTIHDNGNTGGGDLSASDSATIDIAAVNDAPVNHGPASVNATEDTAFAFTGGNTVSVTDVDIASGTLSVELTVQNGTLTVGTANVTVGGNGSDDVTISGSLADVNAALAGMTYTGDANYNGSDTLHIVSSDGGATGGGGTKTDTDDVTINVAAVNDTPVLSSTGPVTTNEQTAVTVAAAITVADADLDAFNGGAGDYAGATLRAANNNGDQPDDLFTIVNGTNFTVSGSNLVDGSNNVFATFTGGNGTQLVITFTSSGTPATTALVQDVAQHIQYTNTSDTPPASVDVAIVLNDGDFVSGNQGVEPNSSFLDSIATDVVTVNLTAVDDAPVNHVPGAQTASEDGSLTFSAANSNAITVTDVDAGSGNVTVTVSVGHGTLTLGSTSNLTVTGNGTGSVQLTGTLTDINAGLDGTVYTPTGNFNGDDTVHIVTSDNSNTGTGGPLTDTDDVAVHVTAVNDAPTVVNGTTATAPAIDEDSPPDNLTAPTVSSLFSSHYSDATDDQSAFGGSSAGAFTGIAVTANGSNANGDWQYWNGSSWVNIGAVSNASALTLDASTPIRFNPAADYNGPAPTITVHLADNTASITNGGHIDLSGVGATGGTTPWSTGTVDLQETVNPVNDAPVLDLNGAGGGTSTSVSYTEGDPLLLIAPSGTVSDIDSPNYDNGVLTIAFTANGTTDDELLIKDQGVANTGNISADSGAIYYQFGHVSADPATSDIRLIGTYTGGTNGDPLVITFNSEVTPTIAQQVLEDIGYENISNAPSTLDRTVTFTLMESDGTTSSPVTATISVTAVDNPAILNNDFATTDEVHPVNIDVLANDSDPDGPPPTVTKINGQNVTVGTPIILASGALATLNANGTINYDPNHKFDTLTNPSGGETGASNTQGTDSFSYSNADGSTTTVTVTIGGVAGPGDWLRGTNGNDNITGTAGADLFMMMDGTTGVGNGDTTHGLGGNDAFYYGAVLNANDANDGGDGRDVVILQGDYSGGLTLGAHNLDNIEALSVQSGSMTFWGDDGTHHYSYDITTVDANVAAGGSLIVNGSNLLAGENFTFNGSAETDGSFVIYGGFGTDHLTGGAGNDVFYFEGARWNPSDIANGVSGRDVVVITGNLNGVNHIDIASGQLVNIDAFSVSNVYAFNPAIQPSYEVVLHDGNVTPGGSLIVNANTLTKPTQTFSLDAHEVTGTLLVFGGAGADTIVTGSGNDVIYAGFGQDNMTGGAGADIFQFRALGDSTTAAPDHILDFVSGTDKIDLSFIDANPSTAANDAFVLSNDGTFHGINGEIREFFDAAHGWWVVDADVNGDGQADFSIHVTTAGNVPLVTNDFIL